MPLRRQIAGDVDVLDATLFRAHDDRAGDGDAARRRPRSSETIRSRPSACFSTPAPHDRAARMLTNLPESMTKSAEPRDDAERCSPASARSVDGEPGAAACCGRTRPRRSAGSTRRGATSTGRSASAERAGSTAAPAGRRAEAADGAAGPGAIATKPIARAHERDFETLGPGEDHTFARAHDGARPATACVSRDPRRPASRRRVVPCGSRRVGTGAARRAKARQLSMRLGDGRCSVPLGRFDEALGRSPRCCRRRDSPTPSDLGC